MLNWLKKTVGLSAQIPVATPEQLRQWINDGFAQLQAGKFVEATESFDRILREQPDHADALYLSGVVLSSSGRKDEAARAISRAIAVDANNPSFHHTLANVLATLGKAEEALASYRQATALDPDNAQLHNDFGYALHQVGRADEATDQLRIATRLEPNIAGRHYNLAMLLQLCGHRDEAANAYRDAIALEPTYAEAENNLGVIHQSQGKLMEAIACFRRTLALNPQHAKAWSNLGCVLQASRQVDEAESCLRRSIELDPQDFNAYSNLALVLREQGRLDDCVACSERALAIRDSLSERIRLATLLPVIASSADEISKWRRHFADEIDKLSVHGGKLDDPLSEVGICNFNLAYQSESNKELQKKAARMYQNACPALLYCAPHCRLPPAQREEKLKVGFISKFMNDHSIGRTTRGLLANITRERFHVTALFVPPFVEDFMSAAIRDSADAHLILPPTLAAARERIAELELDILFYQDIGMDPYTYFLAYSRLAPVQCVSFGHPDTTGIPNMDYWVSNDYFEREGAEDDYSERLFQLRQLGSLAYYYRPTLQQPAKNRAYFNLPDDAHLYLCAQALFKLHPDYDAILAGILRGDPDGQIVLVEARNASWGKILRERLQASIPDVAARIRFLPPMSREDFLSSIAVCDVALDTIYFNGMNTNLEAFAVGTPVITMPTSQQRGRHTLGMYKRMEIDDCVAQTPDEYVRMALQLGTDPGYRDKIKEKILSRCSVLYEDTQVAREFERFFNEAHQRTIDGGMIPN